MPPPPPPKWWIAFPRLPQFDDALIPDHIAIHSQHQRQTPTSQADFHISGASLLRPRPARRHICVGVNPRTQGQLVACGLWLAACGSLAPEGTWPVNTGKEGRTPYKSTLHRHANLSKQVPTADKGGPRAGWAGGLLRNTCHAQLGSSFMPNMGAWSSSLIVAA